MWVPGNKTKNLLHSSTTRGSNVPYSDDTTAVDLFCSYFTEEVWALLVTETNCYAQTNRSSKPKARAWTNVTVEELKAFIGLLIIMGVVKLPRLIMYWQTSNLSVELLMS